ncbi:hypothetical protein HG531_008637 [Fusarium graminearum]|nr:hypothetical protein HG531_008637 [Fusarium graminearum]
MPLISPTLPGTTTAVLSRASLPKAIDTLSSGRRLETNGLSLTIGLVDTLSAQRLGSQNNTLLLTLGNVDGTLSLTFGLENLSTLGTLGSDLSVHGLDDGTRSVDISNLVTQAGDTPSLCGIVDGSGNVGVKRSTFLQDMVKDTREQNTVKFQSNVVRSDSTLARDLNGDFLETLDVCDSIDKGHEDSQTRFENAVELSHTLNNPSRLLRHEPNHRVGRESRLGKVRGHNRRSEAGGDESLVRGAEVSSVGDNGSSRDGGGGGSKPRLGLWCPEGHPREGHGHC